MCARLDIRTERLALSLVAVIPDPRAARSLRFSPSEGENGRRISSVNLAHTASRQGSPPYNVIAALRHLRHSLAALAALTCGTCGTHTRHLRHSHAALAALTYAAVRRLRHSHAALAALTCDTHMRHLRHSRLTITCDTCGTHMRHLRHSHATLAALTSHMLHLRHSFWHSSSTIKVTALALRNLTYGTQIAVTLTRGTHICSCTPRAP